MSTEGFESFRRRTLPAGEFSQGNGLIKAVNRTGNVKQYAMNLLRILPERTDRTASVSLAAENDYGLLLYGLNIG